MTLDSRKSWRNNNGGIAKSSITSKMSTTALEKVLLVTERLNWLQVSDGPYADNG